MDTATLPNLSTKVCSIAAGEAHTLILTEDGRVYCWGRGILGRLGGGSEHDHHLPVQVRFGSEEYSVRIVGIAAGAYHSLALAEDFHGEKHSDGDYSIVPCLLNKFLDLHPPVSSSSSTIPEAEDESSLKITVVKAGGMMSLCIDNLGALWMWGHCPGENKEGGVSLISNFTPTPVWDFHGHIVVQVACGKEHVVALVTAGESYKGVDDLVCYTWGNNSHGQLGLGDKENRPRPEVVKTFDLKSPWVICEVTCGAFHTALLTQKKSPSDTLESTCWTFGLGDNGQLGHGTTQSKLVPEPVKELPQNVHLVSVDCGLFHTCVVSIDGYVWCWGMEKGLGLCPDDSNGGTHSGDALSPLLISCNPYQPKFPNPIQVACGAAHTVLVAQEGNKLWSWGRGRSGVLGNGKTMDSYTPTIVVWPPLIQDFKQESEGITETNDKLCSALNKVKLLQTKLSVMERYASMLHGFIFGEPFDEKEIATSLGNSGAFDISREWENILEAADSTKLRNLEMVYRNMLVAVKDKLMKRKIKEIINECLSSSHAENEHI
ncbi:Regulator of chromosome condensation 1/beta-lactamase-inhibitor protein II [Vigna unguiculata]|uniref:Regulator of chromosome condensation 1/beta-lactamase-inhibitor protein II n=1 Tax=Vigna unguiculata TaxID=3917 RepID=A0A4D6MEY9_VIGUN|nr:Regulator of chromosome condensation 1/beta-lactamase-inhibitor protein II [Vigna unguiculata]